MFPEQAYLEHLPDLLTYLVEMLRFVITSGLADVQAPITTEPRQFMSHMHLGGGW